MKMAQVVECVVNGSPRLRRAVTTLRYGSRDTTVELMGVSIEVNASSENGYVRAAAKAKYSSFWRGEAPVLANLGRFACEGGAFVDAGANVGVYSSFFSRYTGFFRQFGVHAFEVAPATYERLRRNARRHGFQAYNVALGPTTGRAQFVRGAVSHVTTLVTKATRYAIASETFWMDVQPLHAFDIPGDNIVLKIDVEGQEAEVLAGALPFFEQRRVSAVYCDGWSSQEVCTFLRRFGFAFYDGCSLRRCAEPPWSLLALRPDL